MSSILLKKLVKPYQMRAIVVGTWSNKTGALIIRPEVSNLPQLYRTGLFGIPMLDKAIGFAVLKAVCVKRVNRLINEAISPSRSRKIVEVLDEISDAVCQVADLADFIRLAHSSAKYRYAADETCLALHSLVEKLNTHVAMYKVLKKTLAVGDKVPTSEFDRQVGRLFLSDFERSGINLKKKKRELIVHLNGQIVSLGQKFSKGCYKARYVETDVVPHYIRYLFPRVGNRFYVNGICLDDNPEAREVAYKIFYSLDEDQRQLLDHLLGARYLFATLCGYKTFADRALQRSIIETPVAVKHFLEILNNKLRRYADSDFVMMKSAKMIGGPVAMWDVDYYMDKMRKEIFAIAPFDLSPYLPLDACLDGLSNLLHKLYRIRLVRVNTVPGETWAPNVYKLVVVHEIEGLLGYIYCDLHPRKHKLCKDCTYTIRCGKILQDGTYQLPICVVSMNVPTPRLWRPTILSPAMLDSLFHEMGHAVHTMLGRTPYHHVSGNRCSIDFAEVPSVLMEHFASDPRVLRTFARHVQTGKPMPDDLIENLCSSKQLFLASKTQAQVFYSAVDQAYHGKHPLFATTTKILALTQAKYYSLPYVDSTSWQLRFSHLFEYGANYYAYLVSKAVVLKIWETHFEKDPFNGVAGERFRRECLAHGGGKPPRQIVADFLGEDPTPQVLAEAIVKNVALSQGILTFKNN